MFYEAGHGDECPCDMCEPRCCVCEARVPKEEAERHPAQTMCVDCVKDAADEMTPMSLPQLCAEIHADRRFGWGDSDSPLKEKIEQLRRVAA